MNYSIQKPFAEKSEFIKNYPLVRMTCSKTIRFGKVFAQKRSFEAVYIRIIA